MQNGIESVKTAVYEHCSVFYDIIEFACEFNGLHVLGRHTAHFPVNLFCTVFGNRLNAGHFGCIIEAADHLAVVDGGDTACRSVALGVFGIRDG